MPLPALDVVRRDDEALPVESLPSNANVFTSAEQSLLSTLGSSGVVRGEGALLNLKQGGDRMIPRDQAASWMTQQGYDPKVLPAGDVSVGMLSAISNQQSILKRDAEAIKDSNMSGTTKAIGSFVGSLGDPLFLAAGPVLGKVAAAGSEGLPLLMRAGVGAGEGSTIMLGYDEATKHFGTAPGDADMDTYSMAHDALWGGLLGGAGHAAFGMRPVTFEEAANHVLAAEGGAKITTDTGGLTKFGISQKAHPGLDIANLTQDEALKLYKSEYWDKIGASQLPPDLQLTAFDAAINQGVEKTKSMLAAAHGNVEVFNNMRRAEYEHLAQTDPAKYGKYLQGWLNRLDNLKDATPNPNPAVAADPEARARQSVAAAVADSEVPGYRTNPFKIRDEHEAEVLALETQAAADTFKPGSAFARDPDVVALKTAMAAEAPTAPPLTQEGPQLRTAPVELPEDEVVQEATQAAERAGEADTFKEHLSAEEASVVPSEASGMAPDEYGKAVETAVRCGVALGFD